MFKVSKLNNLLNLQENAILRLFENFKNYLLIYSTPPYSSSNLAGFHREPSVPSSLRREVYPISRIRESESRS
jgi:hypothetical protein